MQKSIGQAAKESGIGIETIRYYEREGITPRINRAANGRRQFDRGDISRLKFIKRFRSLGFSIADIKRLQQLAFSSDNSCEMAASIANRNLGVVRGKIADLQEIEIALETLVQQCTESPVACPMLSDLQVQVNGDCE